jgi:hypothetical protein
MSVPKKRLGELLLEAGAIDEAMLQSALGHQRRWGGRLGQALLDLKLVPEPAVVEALARSLGFEVARLGELEPYALDQAKKLVGRDFAQRNNVFPMAADTSTITVAMSDPTNLALTDELRFRTGRRVKVCIGGDREIAEAIRTHYPTESKARPSIAIDLEITGEGLTLAEPFEGGSTEAMRAMLEPTSHADQPAPRPPPAPLAPAAPPQPARPIVPPPSPQVVSAAPIPSAAPAARPAPAAAPGPRPLATPVPSRPAAAPVAVPAAGPAPGDLLGAIPRGGFASNAEEPLEELSPAPLDEGEPILATDLAPEEEMVEGRVPIRELSPRDLAILDALERMASGASDPASAAWPTRVAAVLLRLLLKKRLVTEQELLDELTRHA